MKRALVGLMLVAACGTDDPSNGANTNNTNNSNNSNNTNQTTGSNNSNNSNNTNNLVTNNSNNSTTNNANNTNNSTSNNGVPDAGMPDLGMEDMGQDMADVGEVDAGVDVADMGGSPDGELCATAIELSVGQALVGQSTVGAGDDYSARASDTNCPNNFVSGGDLVYVFSSAVPGDFRVTVTPDTNFDPSIYVRTDCAASACVTGTVLNGAGVAESLTFTVAANTDYFVIVDGEIADEGVFSILLEAL